MVAGSDEATAFRDRVTQLLAAGQTDAVLVLLDELATQRDGLATKVERRDAEIARLRGLLYGRKSEKLTREQLGQLVLSFGASEAEAAEDDPKLPVPAMRDGVAEDAPTKRRRPNHRGRSKLSPDLERIVRNVAVPEDERTCKVCGETMEVFGHVDHEQLEHVPAKLLVHVERREKLACKHCKCDAITAEREVEPDVPLRVGASLLAYLIESKCDDALPIHRQCDQFARLGFELPPSTAYGYWRYATDLLLPLSTAMLGAVLDDPIWVGVDDTRLDVLDRSREAGKYRGHLWCFHGSTGAVAYQFTKTWCAEEIAPWFHAIGEQTHIQVDDYKGYNSQFENPEGQLVCVVPPERRLGCMMHVRRRFHAALKAGDQRAGKPVECIQEIYKVEALARGRPPEERLALRQEHSLPFLDVFDGWVDEHVVSLGKTIPLAKAARYAEQQRVYVRRCFSDGRFEIDNGAVERDIREPAIGRKNFLFTGSAQAAQRLAGAYTLVQSCRALGVPTRDYLIDVITKLERRWPARRLTELLPHRWTPQQSS